MNGYVFSVFCEALKDTTMIHKLLPETKAKVLSDPSMQPVKDTLPAIQAFTSILTEEKEEQIQRAKYFNTQFKFVNGLTKISTVVRDMWFRTKEEKNEALRYALKLLGSDMGWVKGVCLPYLSPSGISYRVVRIPPTQACCLNSRDRVGDAYANFNT